MNKKIKILYLNDIIELLKEALDEEDDYIVIKHNGYCLLTIDKKTAIKPFDFVRNIKKGLIILNFKNNYEKKA